MEQNNLLDYLDFIERFEIHPDDNEFQLGLVIIQENKPIYFYDRKLTGPQKILQ